VDRLHAARRPRPGVKAHGETLDTDNGGLHGVRLPFEYENLMVRDVIGFEQMRECQANSFKYAFAARASKA
jgi:adenosine deaminase